MSLKSQFVAGTDNSQRVGYLKASLNLMVADTRAGATPDVRRDFAVVKTQAARHPTANLVGYVHRVGEAIEQMSRVPSTRPGSGM